MNAVPAWLLTSFLGAASMFFLVFAARPFGPARPWVKAPAASAFLLVCRKPQQALELESSLGRNLLLPYTVADANPVICRAAFSALRFIRSRIRWIWCAALLFVLPRLGRDL